MAAGTCPVEVVRTSRRLRQGCEAFNGPFGEFIVYPIIDMHPRGRRLVHHAANQIRQRTVCAGHQLAAADGFHDGIDLILWHKIVEQHQRLDMLVILLVRVFGRQQIAVALLLFVPEHFFNDGSKFLRRSAIVRGSLVVAIRRRQF